ncbi:MAG TPA: hypothetical protein VFL93_12890 [Longimicrobiaceae bacterium]|nr:hypothetical protein [Longimicrobiaceae bacterium]
MARRPNYGAEKRQKEIRKQQKQAEKAEKKRARKDAASAEDQGSAQSSDDVEPESAGAVTPSSDQRGNATA